MIPDFWNKEIDHSAKLDVKRFLKKDGPQKFLNSKDFLEFERLFRSVSGSLENDLDTYIGNAMYGTFYEYIEHAMLEMTGTTYQDRKEVKQMIFQVLFTDNRFFGQKEAGPKRLFKQLFPTVYRLFSLIKRHDKRVLPILLQRMESYIILQVVCKKISTERPQLPFFTIHDIIITVQGEEDYLQGIMRDEFIDQIAFPPSFNVEYWTPENLRLSDGSLYQVKKMVA